MYPKCTICGSRTWRYLTEVVSNKKSLFFYQCSNNHVHVFETMLIPTTDPLVKVGGSIQL